MAAYAPYTALSGEAHQPASADRENFETTPAELTGRIARWSCGLLLIEYVFVPISYFLGAAGFVKCSQIIQLAFLAFSTRKQWRLYEEVRACWVDRDTYPLSWKTFQTLSEPLREVSGVPMARLNVFGVSEAKYLLLSLCPNFINVLATATFVGGSTLEWENVTDAQRNFTNMWDPVPVVGHAVGHTPLPQLLTYLLLWACFVHVSGLACWAGMLAFGISFLGSNGEQTLINLCDSANMLFIGKVLARREMEATCQYAEAHGARFLVTFSTKTFMLWGKISLMSVIVEELTFWPKIAAWQAIFLSFYSTVLLVVDYWKMLGRFGHNLQHSRWQFVWNLKIMPFVFLVLVVLPIHVMGIIYCPNHDYSLLRMRCT